MSAMSSIVSTHTHTHTHTHIYICFHNSGVHGCPMLLYMLINIGIDLIMSLLTIKGIFQYSFRISNYIYIYIYIYIYQEELYWIYTCN